MPLPGYKMQINLDGSMVHPLPTFPNYQSPTSYTAQPTDNALLSQSGQSDNQVPAWQPPTQTPPPNQNNLFNQNTQTPSSIPNWKPPTDMAGPYTNQFPSVGSTQNSPVNTGLLTRYQSPSTRYVRNQRTF